MFSFNSAVHAFPLYFLLFIYLFFTLLLFEQELIHDYKLIEKVANLIQSITSYCLGGSVILIEQHVFCLGVIDMQPSLFCRVNSCCACSRVFHRKAMSYAKSVSYTSLRLLLTLLRVNPRPCSLLVACLMA